MAKSLHISPLRDNVIIEPQSAQDITESGIVIPDTVDKDKPEQGRVVAVGPGKISDSGDRVDMEVKKGDLVLFSKYGPTEITIKGKEYLIAKEEDILAILQE